MNTTYTPEQLAAIDAAIVKANAEQIKTAGWVSYDWSDRLAERGADQFAVFGDTAYHLSIPPRIEDPGAAFDYIPVVLDGRMFREYPDEGRVGLLYLLRCARYGKKLYPENPWQATFLATRWLFTSELELSNEEIAEHIAAEIDAGENVLTRKLPGWV